VRPRWPGPSGCGRDGQRLNSNEQLRRGPSVQSCLAVELASTVHHERDEAGTEQLASPRQTAQWLRSCGDLPTDLGPTPLEEVLADEHTRAELVQLRDAIRTLFARLVDPEAPGAEDPHPSPGEYGGKDGEDGQV